MNYILSITAMVQEFLFLSRDRRGHDCMLVGLQLPMHSVPIREFESRSGEEYWTHYVTKFVINLLQVDGFLQVLRFNPHKKKLTTTI